VRISWENSKGNTGQLKQYFTLWWLSWDAALHAEIALNTMGFDFKYKKKVLQTKNNRIMWVDHAK
jgi:hypothetical protein